MRPTALRQLGLCLVIAASVASLSAQRGAPRPISTDPFNVWSAEQLAKPGSRAISATTARASSAATRQAPRKRTMDFLTS